MGLPPGSRIGPYEVVSSLGAGGMGEVYRARDPRLNREAALKVLPALFANDPERMARFEREAQVLASLNHPGIATLYGLEDSGATRALVMELVEGPTLADRIAGGPIPLADAVAIARQIAEALEYAHERGVVHRDLKPANIKVTSEGVVKLLDFGLAKALDDSPVSGNIQDSPTLSLPATRTGVILGTAAYMAPEQARGKPADRRADIWAFGVVLAEMLTGRRLYSGETAAEILANVIARDPALETLPSGVPAAIRRLVTRCLEKDPKQRLQAIGEARIVLEGGLAQEAAPPAASVRSTKLWALVAALILALGSLAALALMHFRESPPAERPLRYTVDAPPKSSIESFAISPDGRHLVMSAATEGKRQLWLRTLDSLQAQPLAGTEDAVYPFWSPDSRNIGFFAAGKLRRTAVPVGTVQTICDAPGQALGGTWNQDGVILFVSGEQNPVLRVSAAGGRPVPLSVRGRFPVFLPDGRHFLYNTGGKGVLLAAIDSPAGRQILPDNSSIAYAPPPPGSRTGHVLFIRDETLMAQRLDATTLQTSGEGFPVAEQVTPGILMVYGPVSVSANGTLVYQAGLRSGQSQLTWYDRSGKVSEKVGAPGRIYEFSLSPDGRTVAAPRYPMPDIWLLDLARASETRFTFDPKYDAGPIWSPDGRRIAYSSQRSGVSNLYLKDAGGAGEETLVVDTPNAKYATDWSRDGRWLVYSEFDKARNQDLLVLPEPGSGKKPAAFLATEFGETQGVFSPDGRWMAYASNESNRFDVYVRQFPTGAGKVKVSVDGGIRPRWRADGRELFYQGLDGKLMSVAVKAVTTPGPSFDAGKPQMLFDTKVVYRQPGYAAHLYEVSPGGNRFLIAVGLEDAASSRMTVVVDWLAALRR